MKKKIKDVTFKEFDEWANMRACDGKWCWSAALVSAEAIGEVLKVNPFFGKAKKREEKWNEIKAKYFNLEGEIEID